MRLRTNDRVGTTCPPIRESTTVGKLVVASGGRSGIDQAVVNDKLVTDMEARVRPEDFLWLATSKLKKGTGNALDARFGEMALFDLERFSDFCETRYGEELVVDTDWEEGYLVVENFPLAPGFARGSIPVLLPLPNYPMQPPPGLYFPAAHPDTGTAKRIFTVFDAGDPPYAGTENLLRQGWAWVCLRYVGNGSDGKAWNYEFTEEGGLDSLASYLAYANACLRRMS